MGPLRPTTCILHLRLTARESSPILLRASLAPHPPPSQPNRLRTPHRPFSSTPSPKSPIDPFLVAASTLLQTLHATTSLPWYLTLPLTALLLRTTTTLPLALFTRHAHIRQLRLRPALAGWTNVFRVRAMREGGKVGGAKEAQRRVAGLVRGKRRELYKRWGCGWWRNWAPVGGLPVWLLVVECVRRMCGTGEGLVGLVGRGLGSLTGGRGGAAEEGVVAGPESGAVDAGIEGTGDPVANLDAVLADLPPHSSSLSPLTANLDVSSPVVPIDPTLSTEGTLWFPSLLAPDPYLLLPFLLSATILLNIPRPTKAHPATRTQRIWTNSLRVFALAVGPLTLQMPAAILVYWVSSSALAGVQGWVVDRVMPIPKEVLRGGGGTTGEEVGEGGRKTGS